MAHRLVPEMIEVFRNASFRVLFLSMLVFASAAGAHSALNNHNYVFVWKLRPETIQFLTYSTLAGITVGVPITPMMLNRLEKKTVVALGFTLLCVGWTLLPVARASGYFAPTGSEALPWLIATQLVVGVGLGFAGKAAAGVGAMVGGFALDLLRFPREAGRNPDAVIDESVLAGLVLAWGPFCAGLCVVGALIFAPYAITRARHNEIIESLRRRRAQEAAVPAA
jgi:GPH family glycoside/pentoside/hexuronide:cation symporter